MPSRRENSLNVPVLYALHSCNLVQFLKGLLKDSLVSYSSSSSSYTCLNPHDLGFVLNFVKKSSFFRANCFTDLTASDRIKNKKRFLLTYFITSCDFNARYMISFMAKENQRVPSAAAFFEAAVWAERECYDLFGIFFSGNKDLRRLLTDYGFSGHPLRKDFPLMGYVEVYYYDAAKCVRSSRVEATQAYHEKFFEKP